MNVNEIRSVNWQLSVKMIGDVAEGIDDIRQCIQIILTTTKGSDPLRPLFGSNIWQHIDKPVNVAPALISSEIIDALVKWEPRIILNSITHSVDGSRVDFVLRITLIESGESTEISFYIDRQSQLEIQPLGRAFSNGFSFGFS